MPERPKTLEAGVEDFVPWVSPISSRPLAREEEEEENEMADLVHKFGARKRKRGASFERATNAIPEVTSEASQQPTDKSFDVQAIVVSDSPEMGFHGQSALKTALLVDLGEVSPIHAKVHEDFPPKQIAGQSDKAKSTRAGCGRSFLPNQLLLNFYIPPQGQASPMEEVSVLGPNGAQEIINRWRPFNQGESLAAHMQQLYPALLRMPVAMRAEGRGKEYVFSVPAYSCKDELKQVVEDEMLIRNRNFI